jgi:flavodoxin
MRNLKRCIILLILAVLIPGLSFAADTWIMYYTRTGTNKIIAEHIQSKMPAARLVEIKANDDRSGIIGFVSSMLDQWLDRDAAITVEDIKPAADDTVIMCAPIWLQQLSSPPRTLIKQGKLKGMKMHLFVTFGGKLNEEKQKLMEAWVRDQGINLQGVYGSAVGGKTPEDIKKQIDEYLQQAGLSPAGAQ